MNLRQAANSKKLSTLFLIMVGLITIQSVSSSAQGQDLYDKIKRSHKAFSKKQTISSDTLVSLSEKKIKTPNQIGASLDQTSPSYIFSKILDTDSRKSKKILERIRHQEDKKLFGIQAESGSASSAEFTTDSYKLKPNIEKKNSGRRLIEEQSSCGDGFYLDNDVCQKCISNCLRCSSALDCYECETYYEYDQEKNTCYPIQTFGGNNTYGVPSTYQGCYEWIPGFSINDQSDSNPVLCQSCQPNSMLNPDSHQCDCSEQTPLTALDDNSITFELYNFAIMNNSQLEEIVSFKEIVTSVSLPQVSDLQFESFNSSDAIIIDVVMSDGQETQATTFKSTIQISGFNSDQLEAFKNQYFSIELDLSWIHVDCQNHNQTLSVLYFVQTTTNNDTDSDERNMTDPCFKRENEDSPYCQQCDPYTILNIKEGFCECKFDFNAYINTKDDQTSLLILIKYYEFFRNLTSSCSDYLNFTFSSDATDETQAYLKSKLDQLECSAKTYFAPLQMLLVDPFSVKNFNKYETHLVIKNIDQELIDSFYQKTFFINLNTSSLLVLCNFTDDEDISQFFNIDSQKLVNMEYYSPTPKIFDDRQCFEMKTGVMFAEDQPHNMTNQTYPMEHEIKDHFSLFIELYGYSLPLYNEELKNQYLGIMCSDILNYIPVKYIDRDELDLIVAEFYSLQCMIFEYDIDVHDTDGQSQKRTSILVGIHKADHLFQYLKDERIQLYPYQDNYFDTCYSSKNANIIQITVQEVEDDNISPDGCILSENSYCLECSPFTTLNFKDNTCECEFHYSAQAYSKDVVIEDVNVAQFSLAIIAHDLDYQNLRGVCSDYFEFVIDNSLQQEKIDELNILISQLECSIETSATAKYLQIPYDMGMPLKTYDYENRLYINNISTDLFGQIELGYVNLNLNRQSFNHHCSNQNSLTYSIYFSKYDSNQSWIPGCIKKDPDNLSNCYDCYPTCQRKEGQCYCPSVFKAFGIINMQTSNDTQDNSLSILIPNSKNLMGFKGEIPLYINCSEIIEILYTNRSLYDQIIDKDEFDSIIDSFSQMKCFYQVYIKDTYYWSEDTKSSYVYVEYQALLQFDKPDDLFLNTIYNENIELSVKNKELDCSYDEDNYVQTTFEVLKPDEPHCGEGCLDCDDTQCYFCNPQISYFSQQSNYSCRCLKNSTTMQFQESYTDENSTKYYNMIYNVSGLRYIIDNGQDYTKYDVKCSDLFKVYIPSGGDLYYTVQSLFDSYLCSVYSESYFDYIYDQSQDKTHLVMHNQTSISMYNIAQNFIELYQQQEILLYLKQDYILSRGCEQDWYDSIPYENYTDPNDNETQQNNSQYSTNCSDNCFVCNNTNENITQDEDGNEIEQQQECLLCKTFTTYDWDQERCDCQFVYNANFTYDSSYWSSGNRAYIEIYNMLFDTDLFGMPSDQSFYVHLLDVFDYILLVEEDQVPYYEEILANLDVLVSNLEYQSGELYMPDNTTVQETVKYINFNFFNFNSDINQAFNNQTLILILNNDVVINNCSDYFNSDQLLIQSAYQESNCPDYPGCEICDDYQCNQCSPTTKLDPDTHSCQCQFNYDLSSEYVYQYNQNTFYYEYLWSVFIYIDGVYPLFSLLESCSQIFDQSNLSISNQLYNKYQSMNCKAFPLKTEYYNVIDWENKQVLELQQNRTFIWIRGIHDTLYQEMFLKKQNINTLKLNKYYFSQNCDHDPDFQYYLVNKTIQDDDDDDKCTPGCKGCFQPCQQCLLGTTLQDDGTCQCQFNYTQQSYPNPYSQNQNLDYNSQIYYSMQAISYKYYRSYNQQEQVSCFYLFQLQILDEYMDYTSQYYLKSDYQRLNCYVNHYSWSYYVYNYYLGYYEYEYKNVTTIFISYMSNALFKAYHRQQVGFQLYMDNFYQNCTQSDNQLYLLKNDHYDDMCTTKGCIACSSNDQCYRCDALSVFDEQTSKCNCDQNYTISGINYDYLYQKNGFLIIIPNIKFNSSYAFYQTECSTLMDMLDLTTNNLISGQYCRVSQSSQTQKFFDDVRQEYYNLDNWIVQLYIFDYTQEFLDKFNKNKIVLTLNSMRYERNCTDTKPFRIMQHQEQQQAQCGLGCIDCVQQSNEESQCFTCNPYTLYENYNEDCYCDLHYSLYLYDDVEYKGLYNMPLVLYNMNLTDDIKYRYNYTQYDLTVFPCYELLQFYDPYSWNQESYINGEINKTVCQVYETYFNESAILNSTGTNITINTSVVIIFMSNITKEVLKAFRNEMIYIFLNEDNFVMDCAMSYKFDPTIYPNFTNIDIQTKCPDGCIYCENDGEHCLQCSPFTLTNIDTQECDCQFSIYENVEQDEKEEEMFYLWYVVFNMQVIDEIKEDGSIFGCAELLNITFPYDTTDADYYTFVDELQYINCYAFQYDYEAQYELSNDSEMSNQTSLRKKLVGSKIFGQPIINHNLQTRQEQEYINRKQKEILSQKKLLLQNLGGDDYNYTCWNDSSTGQQVCTYETDGDGNSTNSTIIKYNTSEVYIVLYNVSQAFLDMYRDQTFILTLNNDSFIQNCVQNDSQDYTIYPNEPSQCENSCLYCNNTDQICELCSPYTTLDEDTGECVCENNYDVTYVELTQNKKQLSIDIYNVLVEKEYRKYEGQTLMCTDIFYFVNFRNISNIVRKYLNEEISNLKCEFNANYTHDVAYTYNSDFDMYYEYDYPYVSILFLNISGTFYDAFKSMKFDLYLNESTYKQKCRSEDKYYQISMYKDVATTTCSKGCINCKKNNTCDQCGPYTFQNKQSCQCGFTYYVQAQDDYYDDVTNQRFSQFLYTFNNLNLNNPSLTDRLIPCLQIFDVIISTAISPNARSIINNGLNNTYCYLSAYESNVYTFDYQSYQWRWVQSPTVALMMYEISDQLLAGFQHQYYNLTLKSSLFSQNCDKPVPLTVTTDFIDDSKCSPGCLSCQDIYSCKQCSANISSYDTLSGLCVCKSTIKVEIYQNSSEYKSESDQFLVIDLYNMKYKDGWTIEGDYFTYTYAQYFFDFFDMYNSLTDPDTDIQFLRELYNIDTVIFWDYDHHQKRVMVSPTQQAIQELSYTRVYLVGITDYMIETILQGRVQLFLVKDGFETRDECSIAGNTIRIDPNNIDLTSSSDETMNDCLTNCDSCDPLGYCLSCSPNTFQSFDRKYGFYKKICTEVCPSSTFPDYDQLFCDNCELDCRVCSSLNECFDCDVGSFAINPQLTQDFSSDLQCNYGSCPSKTFVNSAQQECVPCNSDGCNACAKNPNTCTSCDPYYMLKNGKCQTSGCKPNQYVGLNGKCLTCDKNCSSCAQDGISCTACAKGFLLDPESMKCLTAKTFSCPDGTYLNKTANACQYCKDGCSSCSSLYSCDVCEYGLIPLFIQDHQYCVEECPKGSYEYYDQTLDMIVCQQCQPTCYDCIARTDSQVSSAKQFQSAGYLGRLSAFKNAMNSQNDSDYHNNTLVCNICFEPYILNEGSCVVSCPVGYFNKTNYLGYQQCFQCLDGCDQCSSEDTCDKCSDGYYTLVTTSGTKDNYALQRNLGYSCIQYQYDLYPDYICPVGTYINTNTNECVKCAKGCAQCSPDGQCYIPCQEGCSDCLNSQYNCLSCNNGYMLVPEDSGCTTDCSWYGSIYNDESGQCEECSIYGCDECYFEKGIEKCKKCQSDLYLNMLTFKNLSGQEVIQYTCNDVCIADNEYPDANGVCAPCSKGCLECLDEQTCQTCNKYTVFYPYDSKCYCEFKYEIYPSPKQNKIIVDTLNLKWKNDSTILSSIFLCSYIMKYEWASTPDTSLTQNLDNLRCQISFAHQQNYIDEYGEENEDVSDYRTRIVINNVSTNALNAFYAKKYSLFLNQDKFEQDCEFNYEMYELKLNEADYRNISENNNTNNTNNTNPNALSAEIRLKSNIPTAIRCQNLSIKVDKLIGFDDGIKGIYWDLSVQTSSSNIKYTSDKAALDNFLIKTKNLFSGLQYLNIYSNLTELLIADVQLKATMFAQNNQGYQVKGSITIDLLGSQDFINFTANGTTQSFLLTQGLSIDTSVSHPWCPSDQGIKFAIPDAFNKYCVVYQNTSKRVATVIKNSTDCLILPNESGFSSNGSYFVLLVVNASKGQGFIYAGINLKANNPTPSCQINGGQGLLKIYANKETQLQSTISGDTQESYYYNWNCYYISSGKECSEFQMRQTTDPSLTIEKNTFGMSKQVKITMTIVTQQLVSLSQCSIQINTYDSQPNCTDMNLYFKRNNDNKVNYIDTTLDQNFVCQTDLILTAITQNIITYKWQLLNQDGIDLLTQKDNLGRYKASQNQLYIQAGGLVTGKYYYISCSASTASSEYCGLINATYTTQSFLISLTVNPQNGTAYDTQFKLVANKTEGTKARCSFGCLDSQYGYAVEIDSYANKSFTTDLESFVTQLPYSSQSDGILKIYAKCQDSDLRTSYQYTKVTVKNGTFNKNVERQINSQVTGQSALSKSDLIMVSSQVMMYQSDLSDEAKMQSMKKIADSLQSLDLSSLSQDDIDQVSSSVLMLMQKMSTSTQLTSQTDVVDALKDSMKVFSVGNASSSTQSTSSTTKLNISQRKSAAIKLNSLETDTRGYAVDYQTIKQSSLENIAKIIDGLLSMSEGDNQTSSVNKELIQALSVSASRAAGNLLTQDDSDISLSGEKCAVSLKKVSGTTLSTDGSLSIQVSTASQQRRNLAGQSTVSITIKNDDQFSSYNYLTTKALLADSSQQQNTLQADTTFSSQILVLTVEASDDPVAVSNVYTTQTLDVQGLTNPVTFTVQLDDTTEDSSEYVKKCMYFDESIQSWVQNECEGSRLSSSQMQCCSYHLTQFAVLTVPATQAVSFERSFIIPTVVILDLIIVVGALIGFYFDKKGIINVIQSFTHDEEEINALVNKANNENNIKEAQMKDAKVLPEEMVDTIRMQQNLKKVTKAEILGINDSQSSSQGPNTPQKASVKISPQQKDKNVEEISPIERTRKGRNNAVNDSSLKLVEKSPQQDDLNKSVLENNECDQLQNSQLMNLHLRSQTHLDLLNETREFKISHKEEKRNFLEQYVMILQYYHRLISCLFSEQDQIKRPFKTLGNISQFYVLLLISALLTYFQPDFSIGAHIAICFGSMRILQIWFYKLTLISTDHKIRKMIISGAIFLSALIAGHVIIFVYGINKMQVQGSNKASSDDNLSNRSNMNEWGLLFGVMLIIEIAIWDFILMPLIVIAFGKCKPQWFKRQIYISPPHQVVEKTIQDHKNEQ